MKTSILTIWLLAFSSVLFAQNNTENDTAFVNSELKKCLQSKNLASSELNDSLHYATLVYINGITATIKISKEQGKNKEKKSQYAIHKMSFKFEINDTRNVFDNKYDKSEIIHYINAKIEDYHLTMYPFLSEAYDNAVANLEDGKNIVKNINGFNITATNDFFKGKIEIAVRLRKNNGMDIFVTYEVTFDA